VGSLACVVVIVVQQNPSSRISNSSSRVVVTGYDGQSTGDLRFCMEDVVVVMLSKWEAAVV
jgi:hypothetical protein